MNPEDIQAWSAAISAVVGKLKDIISLIPSSEKKDQVLRDLEQAEKKIREAEAIKAKDIGYDLCYRQYPPHIMVVKRIGNDDYSFCPECKLTWDGRTEHEILGRNP